MHRYRVTVSIAEVVWYDNIVIERTEDRAIDAARTITEQRYQKESGVLPVATLVDIKTIKLDKPCPMCSGQGYHILEATIFAQKKRVLECAKCEGRGILLL